VTRPQGGPSGVRFPSYWLWGPHSLLFSEGQVFFPWGKKRRGCEAGHSPPSKTEVKGIYNSTSPPSPHKESWLGQRQFCSYLQVSHPVVLAHDTPIYIYIYQSRSTYRNPIVTRFGSLASQDPGSDYIIV